MGLVGELWKLENLCEAVTSSIGGTTDRYLFVNGGKMKSISAAIVVASGAYVTGCSNRYGDDVYGVVGPIIVVVGLVGSWNLFFPEDEQD